MTMLPDILANIRANRYVSKFTWIEMMESVAFLSEHSDLGNSLMSTFFRSKRYDQDNEKHELEEMIGSLVKEIDATQGEDRPQVIDYSVWFENRWDRPLFEGAVVRPILNEGISEIFDSFRNAFSDMLIYPRASNKTMSYDTARKLGMKSVTGVEYLRILMNEGRAAGGALEVRQAWRYNDLTPRTYFAQGGTVFRSSMYAQEIFNLLVDSFEVSHRRRRFDLDRLEMDELDDVWVYDYSSFTSNLTEQKYFLRELSTYCMGYPLFVFDVVDGVIRLDLGEYLREYVDVCGDCPEFYLSDAIVSSLGFLHATYKHKRAGALGVYGNLASATVLHGLFSMNITGSPHLTSVVGDDGLIVITPWTESLEEGEITGKLRHSTEVKTVLRLLGSIADWKFAILGPPQETYDSRWTYLKRALIRHEDHLELWDQEHLLNVFFLLNEKGVTLRRTPDRLELAVKSVIGQVTSLLYRIFRKQTSILDVELSMICKLYQAVYRRFRLPFTGSMSGHVVHLGGQDDSHGDARVSFLVNEPICFIPSPEMAHYLRLDPMENLISHHDWSVPVRIPRLTEKIRPPPSEMFVIGAVFESSTSRLLSLLQKMDIVTREQTEVDWARSPGEFRIFRDRLVSPSFFILYLYTVIRKLPPQFSVVLEQSTKPPYPRGRMDNEGTLCFDF